MTGKLYFIHSVMNAGKTIRLIQNAYSYEELGYKAKILTSSVDNRYGTGIVASRIGLQRDAMNINPNDIKVLKELEKKILDKTEQIDVILVDECQFFSPEQIDCLESIVHNCGIPVYCYGIKTDFNTHLFSGSKRLLEIAEKIDEIVTICSCGQKATVNVRLIDSDDQIVVGGNDIYKTMCRKCANKHKQQRK